MANLTERIIMLELRMRYIEQMIGIDSNDKIDLNKLYPKGSIDKLIINEPVEEEMINGFTKSQLRTMYGWAKGLKLQQLSKGDFDELKKWGMLWEFFPNAPDNYDDITL
jgi:hypothetical protein